MSRFLRGYLGALISALVVLFFHADSRPYMDLVFTEVGESPVFTQTPWIPGNTPDVPQPVDTLTSSLWMVAGAGRLSAGRPSALEDMRKMLVVARRASSADPDNAFWIQCSAVILRSMGRDKEALADWLRASHSTRWNDYQSDRLLAIAGELRSSCGVRSSWQVLAVHPFRSADMAKVIERYARSLIVGCGMQDEKSLAIRYATLVNGRLMCDGARSMEMLAVGSDIIEMSSYPNQIEANPTQKSLLLARYALVNQLRAFNRPEQASDTLQTFLRNDGYIYLLGTVDADDEFRMLSIGSVLAACVPSALLAVALVAALIWAAGGLLLRKPNLQKLFQLPYAPIVGILFGIGLYAWLRLVFVALAAATMFAFVPFAPGRLRTRPTEDLGPFFRFALVVVSLALTVLLGSFFMGISSPAYHLLPSVGVTYDYLGGSGALAGLAAFSLSLLLLIAPAWAVARKVSTSWVLALGVRDLGKGLCLGAATLSVLTALTALYVDRSIYQTGRKILENEPVYYLTE